MAVRSSEFAIKLVHAADATEVDLQPLQGLWTEAQDLKLTDHTNRPLELADGNLAVLPMPTHQHQLSLAWLYERFVAYMRPRGGLVLFAPFRLRVAPARFRAPDLVLLRDADDPRTQHACGAMGSRLYMATSPC